MTIKRKVILVTDGDKVAVRVIEGITKEIGGRCISASGGNPTPLSGERLVSLILSTPYDPVIVMLDDNGASGMGKGEQALQFIVEHPQIEVLGVLAVASNTPNLGATRVDYSIDKYGNLTEYQVDKAGEVSKEARHLIKGDTVNVLRSLHVPLVIGIGDIGKMDGFDALSKGAPITRKAIQLILDQSGLNKI